ncbi:YqaA family protein [Pistricoccus aurantiacus]|uniref:YqaA family protein n=1 Tax=Pistricoccus aurantiacus TaxID=1883414 RepID=UPI00363EF09A
MSSNFRSLASASAWLDRLAASNHAYWLLFAASMMETLLIPIPIEVILIPWMLTHPERRWRIATVALAGNLTAALIGYGLGSFAMEQWGDTLIPLFGGQQAFDSFRSTMENNGFLAILAVGITPIPFQTAMLVAGASGYPLILFILAAMIARGIRYFGLALLVAIAGDKAMEIWKHHSRKVGIGLLVIAIIWIGWQFYK